MVASVANTTSTAAATASKSAGLSTAQEQSDRFLKLLVAQLNNQDPMNPMDNAQMTSQMAQINTVSGIQQLNDTIKTMSTQFGAMQVLQGAAMVGRDVLTDGNTMAVSNGTGRGSLNLSGNADQVTVSVMTPGGQVLDTINLGAHSAGRVNFEWDASKYTGSGKPSFSVTATQAGRAVAATTMARDSVTSVNSDNGTMSVALSSGAIVQYDTIKAIL